MLLYQGNGAWLIASGLLRTVLVLPGLLMHTWWLGTVGEKGGINFSTVLLNDYLLKKVSLWLQLSKGQAADSVSGDAAWLSCSATQFLWRLRWMAKSEPLWIPGLSGFTRKGPRHWDFTESGVDGIWGKKKASQPEGSLSFLVWRVKVGHCVMTLQYYFVY